MAKVNSRSVVLYSAVEVFLESATEREKEIYELASQVERYRLMEHYGGAEDDLELVGRKAIAAAKKLLGITDDPD